MLEEKMPIETRAAIYLEVRRRERREGFLKWLESVSPHLQWRLPHLEYMRSNLNAIWEVGGQRQMYFLPPQHGKTTQNTIHFAAYYLLKNPTKRILLLAYNSEYAKGYSLKVRQLYKKEVRLTKNLARRAAYWETPEGGYVKACALAGCTGYAADLIIIDDPIRDAGQAFSQTQRENLWNDFNFSVMSRVNVGTSIIITLTRWHHDDMAGRIISNQNNKDSKKWTVVSIPAFANGNDVLGREEGEALWKERFPRELLIEKKESIGATNFQSLYQQSPTQDSGNIFKVEWWKRYRELPTEFIRIIQSYDTAYELKRVNDFSVGLTIGETSAGYYIIDMFRKKVLFPDLARSMVENYYGLRLKILSLSDRNIIIEPEPRSFHQMKLHEAILYYEGGRWYISGNEMDGIITELKEIDKESPLGILLEGKGLDEAKKIEIDLLQAAIVYLEYAPYKYRPNIILIEKAASGRGIAPHLLATTKLPISAVRAENIPNRKVVDANGVTAPIETGKVSIPEYAEWTPIFIDETMTFPNGAHDDIVDAYTMGFKYLNPRGSCGFF